jgi:hypothetical protein
MHDTTVDRTTSGTGSVSSKSLAQWNALALDPTSGAWFGGGYPDTEAPPVLSDVLDTYIGSALFSIENKSDGTALTALLSQLLSSGVAPSQAVISSFISGQMPEIVASGYRSMFLTTSGAESAATIAGYGVDWVGVGVGTSSAQVAAYLAAGLKVAPWTLKRRKDRDTWLGYGVNGIFADDTKYLKATAALRTTDNFASQTWEHGMLPSDDLLAPASRGQFFSPNYWGYASSETTFRGCLMGFLCPIASPSDFVMDLKVTFTSAAGGDTTRWAGIFLGVDDNPFTNASGAESGYAFLLRKNGEVSIWKKAPSFAAVSQGATSGSTISDGAEKTFRITVTATTVKIAQIDSSGNDVTEKTITDATYRGGYISLSRNGLAAKFRSLSTSATQYIAGAGQISSAEAIGSPALCAGIIALGIGTGEAFGIAAIAATVEAAGIASGEAVGAPAVGGAAAAEITAAGIASAEALGSPALGLAVNAAGIVSAEALGQPNVGAAAAAITGAGQITTAEAVGSPAVAIAVSGAGVSSAEAFGSPALAAGVVGAGGIASAVAVGAPVVGELVAAEIIGVGGIASSAAVGSPTVFPLVPYTGTGFQLGSGHRPMRSRRNTAQLVQNVQPHRIAATGIESQERCGYPKLEWGGRSRKIRDEELLLGRAA